MRQPQDLQMLFFPSWVVLQGFPWPRLGRVIRLQPAAKWQCAKQIYFLQPFWESCYFKLQCVLTCTHMECIGWSLCGTENAHPVHFPVATLEEDSNSNKAISSRGCTQNHQGRQAWWRVSVCCCTHCSWLWSNLNKLEDDVILISTSPGWDVALQSPIPRVFQKKNSLYHSTTTAIPKIVFQNWKKVRQRWGEGYVRDWRIKKLLSGRAWNLQELLSVHKKWEGRWSSFKVRH